MRAIILSAGWGTRSLPRTAHTPKCLLPPRGHETVLEHQLRTLAACGVREATIVVDFAAQQVEACLRERPVPDVARTQPELHSPGISGAGAVSVRASSGRPQEGMP